LSTLQYRAWLCGQTAYSLLPLVGLGQAFGGSFATATAALVIVSV